MQRLVFGIAGLALDVFYRHESFGARVPAGGPLVLVANHPNGLVDPVLLARTTHRTVHFLGKAPLFALPVVGRLLRGMAALPVYRAQDGADTALNAATFEAVFDALRAGGIVCLFPEGRSHSEPVLLSLKTGAARMALGAEAGAGFGLGVRIVPVGLVYRARRRFRSRIASCVGEPIAIDDLAELHGRDDREAVRVLTERIAAGLERVTLTLNRWEDLPLIELASSVWQPRSGERMTALHEFADGVHRARSENPDAIDALALRVAAFRDRLDCLGLGPDNIHRSYSASGVARFVLRNLGGLLLLPFAVVGALAWCIPYWLVPLATRFSSASRDIHATIRILTGLVLFPLWWLAATFAAAALVSGPVAVGVALALPVLGLAALAWIDWREERAGDVRAFLLLARRGSLRERLVRERDEIAEEIEGLRARLLGEG